ncbi:MAG: hypothetical protein WC862_00525 [Patescibacteria group bacterium]
MSPGEHQGYRPPDADKPITNDGVETLKRQREKTAAALAEAEKEEEEEARIDLVGDLINEIEIIDDELRKKYWSSQKATENETVGSEVQTRIAGIAERLLPEYEEMLRRNGGQYHYSDEHVNKEGQVVRETRIISDHEEVVKRALIKLDKICKGEPYCKGIPAVEVGERSGYVGENKTELRQLSDDLFLYTDSRLMNNETGVFDPEVHLVNSQEARELHESFGEKSRLKIAELENQMKAGQTMLNKL